MATDGERRSGQGRRTFDPAIQTREPDVRPLGALALGLAFLSALFAVSYFFFFLAYLVALISFPLAIAARTDERTRSMGTAALLITLFACAWATVIILIEFS